jgi:hypothetical protein
MAERYKELLLAIEEPVTAPLAISYVCYSSTAGVADVTRSEDFPPEHAPINSIKERASSSRSIETCFSFTNIKKVLFGCFENQKLILPGI